MPETIYLDGTTDNYSFPKTSYQVTEIQSLEMAIDLYLEEEIQKAGDPKLLDAIEAQGGVVLAWFRFQFPNSLSEEAQYKLLVAAENSQSALLVVEEQELGDWLQTESYGDAVGFEISGEEMMADEANDHIDFLHVQWPETDEPGKGLEDIIGNKEYGLKWIHFGPDGEPIVSEILDPRSGLEQYRQFWRDLKLEEGPMLLYTHGFLGDVEPSSKKLFADPTSRAALRAKYGNRIIGFDHPTLQHSPVLNARALVNYFDPRVFPEEVEPFQVDILTRSRGCLVARELLEAPRQSFDLPFTVNRLVMLGGPNQGTPSAHPKNLVRSARIYLAIKKIHKASFTEAAIDLEASLALSRAASGFDEENPARNLCGGLEAMNYESDYMREVNNRSFDHGVDYYTIGIEFDPSPSSDMSKKEQRKRKKLQKWLRKSFKDTPGTPTVIANDGIVPTHGVRGHEVLLPFQVGASFDAHFKDGFVMPTARDQHHEIFFEIEEIHEKVLEFLGASVS